MCYPVPVTCYPLPTKSKCVISVLLLHKVFTDISFPVLNISYSEHNIIVLHSRDMTVTHNNLIYQHFHPNCNPVIDLIGWRIKSLNTALRVGEKYCLIWKVRINIKGFSCSSLTIFSKSLKRRTVSSQWSRQNETKWPRIWTSGIVWMMIRRRNNTSIR